MVSAILKCGWLRAILFALLFAKLFANIPAPAPALAQTLPDTTVAAALHSLGARAGVVFAGEVTAVRHIGGVVEVQFRVDQNLKRASGVYILREWSGLWAAGQRRYWVGERALVFLHDPGKSGLSSSVDGAEGILPMVPASGTAGLAVDIQRLRTRVLRASGSAMVQSRATMSIVEVAAAVRGAPAPIAPAPIAPPSLEPRPITHPIPSGPIFEQIPTERLR